MKTLAAIQPSFFPWRGYFDIIKSSDVFIFYDHVQYDKNGWRNRNKVLVNGKEHWITLPIKYEKINKKIKDVKVFNSERSLNKILNTLKSSYGRHPNFKKIYPVIFRIFKLKKWSLLSELNIALTKEVCKLLKIKSNFIISSNLENINDKNLNLINLCKQFNCNNYLSGKSAKSYLDQNLFVSNGINVTWHEYEDKVYDQFNNSNFFFEKLSILDYLFNIK